MRIFSKRRDYYDGASHYDSTGHIWDRRLLFSVLPEIPKGEKRLDKKIKYFSTENSPEAMKCHLSEAQQLFLVNAFEEAPNPKNCLYDNQRKVWVKRYSDFRKVILGYCGKLFYFIVMHTGGYYTKPSGIYRSFEEVMAKHPNMSERKHLIMPLEEWKQKYTQHKALSDIFFLLKTPIFVMSAAVELDTAIEKAQLVLNPSMSFYNLQTIFPPAQAYQDIDHFINNFLTNIEDVKFERPDVLIRDSKGFDNWSFKQIGPKARKQKR